MTTRNIRLYDSTLVTGSSDIFRQVVGGYYEIAIPTLEGTPVENNRVLQYQPVNTSAHATDGFTPVPTDLPAANMIDGIAIDTSLITTTSADSIFPFYTVPVSIMGIGPTVLPSEIGTSIEERADLLNSDEKWKTYILGGAFNTIEYPGILAPGTFEINDFSYDLPYDLLYAKTISDTYSSYQTTEKKSVYNMHLPSYQQFNAANNEKDLLNIYDLIQCSILNQDETYPDVQEQISIGGLYDHDTTDIFDYTEASAPALIKTISEVPASSPGTGPTYVDLYEKAREYYYEFSSEANASSADNSTMSNILFTKSDIKSLFTPAHDYAESLGSYYPFYNQIGLPALPAGQINSTIVKNNFDGMLLKSIRDAFVSELYETAENSFVVQFQEDALDSSGKLYESSRVENISAKYVDFKNVLAALNNTSKAALTDPVRFAGKNIYDNRAITNYSGELSHINKKNANSMLGALQKGLLSLAPTWPKLPSGVHASGYMPWSDIETFDINKFMSLSAASEADSKAECVAYRINKRSLTTGEEFNYMIQNQPPNSTSGGAFDPADRHASWCYYDTQVKYGETYKYTTYAYFMVIGYKYQYSDITLSRRTSEYGQYTAAEIDAAAGAYTCIEFYDPATGLVKPSPMQTIDGTLSPLRINLVSVADVEGYSNPAQELAQNKNINWADFNLTIEPTIKIFEIPVEGAKELTILDNPPPKLDVIPYQVKDQTQSIGFYIKLENSPVKAEKSRTCRYPTPINDEERINYARYLASQNMLDTEKLKYGTISRTTVVEIYRLSKKPESMSDFSGNLVATKSLIIGDKNNKDHRTYISPTCFHEEKISPGHKFYYAFRFLNENNTPSSWSHVIETELIDDGGYKYTNFNSIMEYELGTGISYDQPFSQFKKIIQLRPSIPQIDMDSPNIDYEDTAENQFNNVELASTLSDSLWEKTYKIRLTSKKTGKKIDLNVN